jgi:hypothetical protein
VRRVSLAAWPRADAGPTLRSSSSP